MTAANITIWAEELRPLDEEVALRVVARVRMTLADPPSPAQLREIVRSVKGEYDFGVQGARPLPPKEMTEEERETAMAFFVKIREEMYARHPEWSREGVHRNSMFNETPEERIERTRALAREPSPEPEKRVDLSRLAGDPRSFGACGGTGKRPVEEPDGTLRCPDCGTVVEDIVVAIPSKEKR